MITFDDVSLNYDARHTALSNINIHIDKGEFVFIVGPSGAGKSTFVKILTHELVPETGSVIVITSRSISSNPAKYLITEEVLELYSRISGCCLKKQFLKI